MSTLSRAAVYMMIAVGSTLPATQAIAAGKPTAPQTQSLPKNEFPIVVGACDTTMNGTLFNMTFKAKFDPAYFANRKFSAAELENLQQSFANNFTTALQLTELSGYSMNQILAGNADALASLNEQLAGYAGYLRDNEGLLVSFSYAGDKKDMGRCPVIDIPVETPPAIEEREATLKFKRPANNLV